MKVYALHHGRDIDGVEDVKLIGIYASADDAREACARAGRLPGFRDAPDGFSVDEYEVGRDEWTAGFTTAGQAGEAGEQAA